jgi:putative transposase
MDAKTHLTAGEVASMTGVSKQAIFKRAQKELWPYIEDKGRGGAIRKFEISSLPVEVQKTVIDKNGICSTLIPILAPEAAFKAAEALIPLPSFLDQLHGNGNGSKREVWTPETAISEKTLRDKRVQNIAQMVQEAMDVPQGWKKRKWIETVALKHDVAFQTIYRYIGRYEKRGLAGLVHTKSTKDKPKSWTPEAVDYWIGLCLKRSHRKIDRKDLYEVLVLEAHRRQWNIGGYASALWWYDKKINPQLLALQRGGVRALDNCLPPVLRDYSDLAPFEMLVGDQHRFDFWVVDDDTGEVFRPEGYLWQDLRSRTIYGAALDKKYDAWLIGLSLRIGIMAYGGFKSIYTDNGKPELSRYLTGILSDMRGLGFEWEFTTDFPLDVIDADAEEINPKAIMPGTHKKAIVKNAKAKMIEGTFNNLERILRSHFKIPGNVKRLGGDIHENDIDQDEAKRLAEQNRLPLYSEFVLTLYKALDYYNRQKPHRGVLKEWSWKNKPSQATPHDCLRACYDNGWRPRAISQEACDLIFLARETRTVQLGRIQFQNEFYEHDALVSLDKGQRVNLRYNPMDTEYIHVFTDSKYLCTAKAVEYSSMKDSELSARKIHEKRSRRKDFIDEYRRITSKIPDFREYSKVPEMEKVAALVGKDKERRAAEQNKLYRTRTPEELAAEVATLETTGRVPFVKTQNLPQRPGYFMTDHDRYEWCIKYEIAGGELTGDDAEWKTAHELTMSQGQREYWDTVRECGQ